MEDLSKILELLEVEVLLQVFIFLGASISAFYGGLTNNRSDKIRQLEKKAIPFMLEDFEQVISSLNDINTGLSNFQNVPDELKRTISQCCFKIINQLEESNYKSQEALENLHKILEILENLKRIMNDSEHSSK